MESVIPRGIHVGPVKLERNDIFLYFLCSSFFNLKGLLRVIISLIFITLAYMTYGASDLLFTCLLVFIGLLNPLVSPVIFYLRAIKEERERAAYEYSFIETGFRITAEDFVQDFEWDHVQEVELGKRNIIIKIVGDVNFIIPSRFLYNSENFISFVDKASKEKFFSVRNKLGKQISYSGKIIKKEYAVEGARNV